MAITVSGSSITFPDATTQSTAPIGLGTTWTNVTSSRAFSTTYTNSTGKYIEVSVTGTYSSASEGNRGVEAYINGSVIGLQQTYTPSAAGSPFVNIAFLVPPGATYKIVNTGILNTLTYWWELR